MDASKLTAKEIEALTAAGMLTARQCLTGEARLTPTQKAWDLFYKLAAVLDGPVAQDDSY